MRPMLREKRPSKGAAAQQLKRFKAKSRFDVFDLTLSVFVLEKFLTNGFVPEMHRLIRRLCTPGRRLLCK